MSPTSLKESDIEKAIMSALKKIGGSSGLSLEDIKEHLHSLLDKQDVEIIETCLNGAVDKEIVSLSDGKYKLKADVKMTICFCGCGFAYISRRPKVANSKDKMKNSAEKATEGKGKNEKTAKRPSSMTKINKFCIIC